MTSSRIVVSAFCALSVALAGSACGGDDDDAPAADTGATATTAAAPPALPPGTIAFRRFLDTGQTQAAIFRVSTDGSGERQLTQPPAGVVDSLPDWSPDGSRIAFERGFDDRPFEVHLVNADGSGLSQADPGCPAGIPETQICEETEPAWSPDGTRLAFGWPYGRVRPVNGEDTIEVFAIGIMDPDGGNVRQLTQLKRPTSSEDGAPVWSPDGRRIAFIRTNITASPAGGTALFVVNVDGTGPRRLTPWALRADNPDWSPDGREISFSSEPDASREFYGNLHSVHPDGTGLKQLTDYDGEVQVLGSSFSPDSEWIAFAQTGVGGQPDIFVMRRDGTELAPLTQTPEWESAPDWGPG